MILWKHCTICLICAKVCASVNFYENEYFGQTLFLTLSFILLRYAGDRLRESRSYEGDI